MLLDRIIRAWKDPEFRQNLSEEDQLQLPENPAGAIELTDEELDMAVGGHRPSSNSSSNSSNRRYSNSSNNSNNSNNSSNNSSNRSSNKSHLRHRRRPSNSWRRRRH